jgi:tetratricopeptide (TPR) repeat protein
MKELFVYFFTVLLPVLLFSCATAPTAPEPPKAEEIKHSEATKKEISPTRQLENKSLNIFADILDLVGSTDERQSILPKIEELYTKIINKYPDVPLAQESYSQLIGINLKDYNPPKTDKAMMLYKEFIGKYPESTLRAYAENKLGKSLYKNAEWKMLLDLCAPTYTHYVENGRHPRASLLFMYAEANYHLGNMEEAKKAYEIASELFPELREGRQSIVMITRLTKKKKLVYPEFGRQLLPSL